MKVTECKQRANARNAQLSTGPKSEEAKRKTRFNAIKHGMTASAVVLTFAGESQEEFDAEQARLREELEPVGELEKMMVDRISECRWRLRRVQRCEAGEIRRRLRASSWRKEAERQQKLVEAHEVLRKIPAVPWSQDDDLERHREELEAAERARKHLTESSDGIELLLEELDKLWKEFARSGKLSEASVYRMFRYLAFSPAYPFKFDPFLPRMPLEPASRNRRAEAARKSICAWTVAQEIIKLKLLKGTREVAEKHEAEAREASALLPAGPVADKLLRYESTIERQLYRARGQFERLQRQRRRGEATPAS